MGKHKDGKHKDKSKKEKRKRKRKTKELESESDSDVKEYKHKKRKHHKDDSSTHSSSSGSSSDEKTKKKAKKKTKSAKLNTELLGTVISERDYESTRVRFKVWLTEDEKCDLPISEVESKNDLLMSYYGKFTKLWNEGKLHPKYYYRVEDDDTKTELATTSTITYGPEALPNPESSKFTARGDGGLSDRYLTGSRHVPWITKRVSQIRNKRKKSADRLSKKAEQYQQKEREKMEDFKRVMGLT